jgi:replicative DNA helicase
MLSKKFLNRMTQEELYEAFLEISNRIEDETIRQFGADKASVVPYSQYLPEAIELLTDPEKNHGIPTGYSDIDSLTKGFEPSELIIVGAVEGVGKSMFVQNIFHNLGQRNIPNLFISMEMSNIEAQKRYVEMQMDVENTKKEEAAKEIKKMPLFAYETENMNLDELDEKIGQAIKEHNIKIVGIDHLHYFAPQDRDNSSAVIGYLVRKLKGLSRKHEIPFVVISHLTKLKKKGMPDKSALRDSSFIAQDADTVIMLNRDWMAEDMVKRKTLEFSVQKNRTRGFLGEGKLYIQQHYKITEEL